MAHHPSTSTTGSSDDRLPQLRRGAPSAAANRNIDERRLRDRTLQSQWSDEQDRQHRAFLDRQASQTAAVINAANAAREDMQRRLSQPGEGITQVAASTASLAPPAAASTLAQTVHPAGIPAAANPTTMPMELNPHMVPPVPCRAVPYPGPGSQRARILTPRCREAPPGASPWETQQCSICLD